MDAEQEKLIILQELYLNELEDARSMIRKVKVAAAILATITPIGFAAWIAVQFFDVILPSGFVGAVSAIGAVLGFGGVILLLFVLIGAYADMGVDDQVRKAQRNYNLAMQGIDPKKAR